MFRRRVKTASSPPSSSGRGDLGPEGVRPAGGLLFDAALSRGNFTLDAAFEVGAGEVVALVGPSGSGKSTCLHLIAGLARPDRGIITFDEAAMFDAERRIDLPPDRRRVAIMFQDYALFPHLTIRENVAYGPRAQGRRKDDAGEIADRWLARVELSEWADRPARTLSGGQQQRAALARAFASDPRALLLDEPFGALDSATRAAVRGEIRGFLDGTGLPTVIVTHDPDDALFFCDRIVVLERGRIVQMGTKQELIGRPCSSFVSEFFRVDPAVPVADESSWRYEN